VSQRLLKVSLAGPCADGFLPLAMREDTRAHCPSTMPTNNLAAVIAAMLLSPGSCVCVWTGTIVKVLLPLASESNQAASATALLSVLPAPSATKFPLPLVQKPMPKTYGQTR
jgi:hypothetical protein